MHAHLRDDEFPHAQQRQEAGFQPQPHTLSIVSRREGQQVRRSQMGGRIDQHVLEQNLLRMPGDEADHRRPLGALEVKEGQEGGRASLRHGATDVHEIHRLCPLDERQILEGRHRLDSTTKLAIRPEDRLEALEFVQERTERQKPHQHGRRHVHDQESVHIDARVQERQGNREE